MGIAIKKFEVEESVTREGWYKITVSLSGKVVDTFLKRTMGQALEAYYAAGYKPVAWAEGNKIILHGSGND